MNKANSGDFAVAYDHIMTITKQLGPQEAAHYLIYCCGRKGTHSLTRWSKHALSRYTGVTARQAHKSERNLISGGFVAKVRDGKHPQFQITPSATGEYLWLNKTFVMGASDETPPLRLLYQTGNLEAFRLMMDYYWLTDIVQEGGLWQIWINYNSEYIAEHAHYSAVGFSEGNQIAAHSTLDNQYQSIWSGFDALFNLGLIYKVPYLFPSATSEPLFPLVHPFTQKPLTHITNLAVDSLNDVFRSRASLYNYCLLIPRHMGSPIVKAMFVPRYTPHTARWKAAFAITEERIRGAGCLYQGVHQGVHQRDISKITSNTLLATGDQDASWAYE